MYSRIQIYSYRFKSLYVRSIAIFSICNVTSSSMSIWPVIQVLDRIVFIDDPNFFTKSSHQTLWAFQCAWRECSRNHHRYIRTCIGYGSDHRHEEGWGAAQYQDSFEVLSWIESWVGKILSTWALEKDLGKIDIQIGASLYIQDILFKIYSGYIQIFWYSSLDVQILTNSDIYIHT